MRKIISIASIGLLALTIFGCSKKTNKTTTKDNTTTTTKKSTDKITTKANTTTENKKEFKEVSYETLKQRIDTLDNYTKYKRIIANGERKYGPNEEDIKLYLHKEYLLNEYNTFATNDGGDYYINSMLGLNFIKSVPNSSDIKFYLNKNNEIKITKQIANDVLDTLYFNEYGYLVKEETSDDSINIEYSLYETATINGYELITKDEATEIYNTYSTETNKYPNAKFSGTYLEIASGTTYSVTNELLQFKSFLPGYTPYDDTNYYPYGFLNAEKPTDSYGLNNFYLKNSDNELALLSFRKSTDRNGNIAYADRFITFNDCGYATSHTDRIISNEGYNEFLELINFEVTYYTGDPMLTITLNAGLGEFSNGKKYMEIEVPYGSTINDIKAMDVYETPTLSNSAVFYSNEWFDEKTKMVYNVSRPIQNNMTFTYGFIDQEYTSSPVVSLGFATDSLEESREIIFKVDYISGANNGVIISTGADAYYYCSDTITFNIRSQSSLYVWGAFNSLRFSEEEGILSSGNNRINYISCIVPVDIKAYAYAYMKGLGTFSQGSSTDMAYSIGDHAFYESSISMFSASRRAPESIGSYAFAKTQLGSYDGTAQGILFDAKEVAINAFAEIPTLQYIYKNIIMDYDEEYETYTINNDTFIYENWAEGWNGTGENKPQLLLYMPDRRFSLGQTLVLSSKDAELTSFCVSLSKSYTFDISIVCSTETDSKVSLTELSDDTNILYSDKDNPATLDDYVVVPSGDNWYKTLVFNIDNKLEENDNITISITSTYNN